jgi:predicted transcriptional regulator
MQKSTVGKTVNTGVKLDETLHARLKALGTLKERSPHWLMRAAIEEYVQREEQYEREKAEDLERWERYKLSGKSVPHSEVEKWLASWGSKSEVPCPK